MELYDSSKDIGFQWDMDPNLLRELYNLKNFDLLFFKQIAKDVISILSPQLVPEPHNLVYDEELVYQRLIGPLERFVLKLDKGATEEDVRLAFERVCSTNKPSKLCRRILKSGDVTFSCNDCGLDATCVVCIDCFHKGAHKDHNYRMSNSEGGGCCDCGDIEAWKQNYACSDHIVPNQASMNLSDFEDISLRTKHLIADQQAIIEKISLLPEDIATRYFLICQASLHYALMMLTWENYKALPQCLEVSGDIEANLQALLSKEKSAKNYFTVVFNDEVHTYDHVINTLVRIIKCTKMTASIIASTVSREGRSFVSNGTYTSCKQVGEMIANVRDSSQDPLKVEVIHGAILAHQTFALKLIEWVKKMSSICDAFRCLTAKTLLGYSSLPEETPRVTLAEKIMLSNTGLWKSARVEWNDLFVTTMLTDYSIKEQLARLITRIYPKLMKDFIRDDHDHSVSILTMTTQLYTVPSLICMLIEEENALSIISQTLIDTCKSTKRENPTMNFENRNTFYMHGLKRGFYIIADLRYLINIQPTKWTDQLRKNVIEAVKIFLKLLSSMQGMDSVKRQLGQHLEYEPDWESGMTLQSRLITFISRLVTYCSYDEEVLVEVLRETQKKLVAMSSFKTVTKELFGHRVSCIQYDVSNSPVSVHLPLTRFAGALILELMRIRPSQVTPYDQSLVILVEEGPHRYSMVEIMEPSLRTEIMIAQFRSGMWRRNGYSLVNQILYFHGALMRREMFDRDILVLQECAAMCEANEFIVHLLNKFQLFTWVTSETTREPLVGNKSVSFYNDEEIMAQTMSLGEEFLQLLLTLISERYHMGVGVIEEEDIIKNEIIQLLCISPSTRSDLTQKLYVNDNELDCIKAVANLRRSTESSTGKYELKDEYYDRFNPFFYHYTRRHQSNALDAQLKRKKNLKESLICCPPPVPVQLTKQFSNLNQLLKCDFTLTIIQKILRRALGQPENFQECATKAPIRFFASDLQLDQSLHLIGLGLHEQTRDPHGFNYLQAAYDNEIFQLLRECYEKAGRSKDLILWLMKKTNELIDTISATHPSDDVTIGCIKSVRECFHSVLSSRESAKQDNKIKNSELAVQRRERIMAMMKANQDKFLSNPTTKQLVAESESNSSPKLSDQPSSSSHALRNRAPVIGSDPTKSTTSPANTSVPDSMQGSLDAKSDENEDGMYDSQMNCESDNQTESSSIDAEQACRTNCLEASHLCILCRDEQKIGLDQPTMVLLAYIQRSSVLSKNRSDRRIPNYALTPSNQLKHRFVEKPHSKMGNSPDLYSYTSDNGWSFDATFMPSDLFFGPHISTCGHVMHFDCWQGFSHAVMKRETSRPNRNTRHVSFEIEKGELLCPLCECISNATIPLLPNFTRFATRSNVPGKQVSVFNAGKEVIERSSENLSACLHALRGSVDMLKHIQHIREFSPGVPLNPEDKHMRLLQPKSINDVLEGLDEDEALGLRDFINTIKVHRLSAGLCTRSLLSSIMSLAERIHMVSLDLDRSVVDVNHARIFMMTTWCISYTVQVFERVSRFRGSPLFEDMDSSKNMCLSYLLRFSCGSIMTLQSDMIQSLLIKKLRWLLISEEHLGSSPCCLDVDAFELFVSLSILLQKLYTHDEVSRPECETHDSTSCNKCIGNPEPSPASSHSNSPESQNYPWVTKAFDHEYFRNLMHLMTILNMLQVIIGLQNELNSPSPVREGDTVDQPNISSTSSQRNECSILYNFYKEIILTSGHPNSKVPQVDEDLCMKLKSRLLPFLRSCAVYFFHLSKITPPTFLQKKTAFFEGKDYLDPQTGPTSEPKQSLIDTNIDLIASVEEFDAVCSYLDLPSNLNDLLQSQEARHLSRIWLRHSRVLPLIKSALQTETMKHPKSKLGSVVNDQAINTDTHHPFKLGSSVPQAASLPCSPCQQFSKTELMPVRFIHQPHSVNRLIDLPYDYSELVDKVSDFSCPSIKNEDSRTPTLCLICGVMLCSQSYCCQRDLNDLASNYQEILQRQQASNDAAGTTSSDGHQMAANQPSSTTAFSAGMAAIPADAVAALSYLGSAATLLVSSANANLASPFRGSSSMIHQQLVGSCTYHAYECSGGVGVFLRIRNCQILLLSGRSKGCYMAAPYIDDHGETDFGLIRGNPLHLNGQHYEKLQQMWLTHAIPEQISRTLEYSAYASSINWHLH